MKAAGYNTAHIGKWHLGYDEQTMPLAQGFDYSFGHMGGCIDNYSHFFYWNGPNRHDLWENGEEVDDDGHFFPDLMVQKAGEFIRANSDNPFFMYYAINVPHYPYQPTEKWREHYKDMDMPRRDYAGFVSTMDERVGRLFKILEDEDILDNTIIIYLSDHGHSCEERAFGGGGYAGPYRGAKTSFFEGGLRVPAIISWPEVLPENKVVISPSMSMDLLPTIAELCGITELPVGVEGLSLKSKMVGELPLEHEVMRWKLGAQWAIRQGPWKLIGNPKDPSKRFPLDPELDKVFLTNLEMDSTEQFNLATAYPSKVRDLVDLYLQWEYANQEDIPLRLPPMNNSASGARIDLFKGPAPEYVADGPQSLVDNKRGTFNFQGGNWVGFQKEDLSAEIDLDSVRLISAVRVRCLQDPGNHIFLPTEVHVSFSTDGEEWNHNKTITAPEAYYKMRYYIHEFEAAAQTNARYIKVEAKNIGTNPDWHANAGESAWLFVDEIIVQ